MASLGHEKVFGKVVDLSKKLKKLGEDDPRRVIHSLKVGLAITLVSLFLYLEPLYDGLGLDAIWAVLTVVVVFEFSVGATIGKGLNRMLATLLAGGLGVGAHYLATLPGKTGEAILIAVFVFIIAAIVSFLRFFPELKARFDYGLMIFILTFSLVSVNSFRDDDVIGTALRRLITIIIGSCTSVMVSIFICPVWIGVELHKLVAGNLQKLGNFLEGFADEYFELPEAENSADKSFLEGYKSVLTSKSNEDTMANLARWEPCHGRFRFRHPWQQYLIVANLARQCAYKIEALHSYLKSEVQTPQQDRSKIHEPSKVISSECGKALKELALTIKKMTRSSMQAQSHLAKSSAAAENLKTVLRSGIWKESDLLQITPAAAVASLLLEVVSCVQEIAGAVCELESLAHFNSSTNRVIPEVDDHRPQDLDENDDHQGIISESPADRDHVIITVSDGLSEPSLNENSSMSEPKSHASINV